jgi:hypothetical protein
MVRIPRATARTLDRLSRHAHAFHRFAHHPLCDRYAGEVIRLGKRSRICRGCVSAAAGALIGVTLAVSFRPPFMLALLFGLSGVALGVYALRYRVSKSLGRLLPALLMSAASVGCALAPQLSARAFAAALLVGAIAISIAYRRRGPNRSPCASCPERQELGACSGYRPIVARERAFRRMAQRLIDSALAPPG